MTTDYDVEDDAGDDWDGELLMAQSRVEQLAGSLSSAGAFLEVLAVVVAVSGVIGGAVLAQSSNTDGLGNRSHPYVASGIGLMIGSIVGGVLYWADFRVMRVVGEYARFRAGGEVERHRYQWQGESARAKVCPDCSEDVWEEARVCPHCRYRFAPAGG
jgi:hypothetical protein